MKRPLSLVSSRSAACLTAALLGTLALACGGSGDAITSPGGSTPPPAAATVASVAVSPSTARIAVGASTTLTATPKDAAGTAVAGQAIAWTSSNSAVAQVSTAGVVTGTGSGTATITATAGGQSGSATVTVTGPVASVVLTPNPDTLYSFVVDTTLKRVQLAVTLKDSAGNVLTGVPVTYASSNTDVVTVDANGLVRTTPVDTALYQSATITATAGGKSGTATVVVYRPPPATLTVSPTSATLSVGDTLTPVIEAYDARNRRLCCRVIEFDQGSTAGVVSVTGGQIKALKSGTTTVRYAIEGVITSIAITVR